MITTPATTYIDHPLDTGILFRKKKAIRRQLAQVPDLIEKRVAVLGGSTTAEIRDMIEIFLLKDGIRPVFFESGYNRFFEDVMFDNPPLQAFAPEIIYIHTSSVNISQYPTLLDGETEVETLLTLEISRYQNLWDRIAERYQCPIIQNNFELPHYRGMGNLDAYDIRGRSRFITDLNNRFSEEARRRSYLHLNDINYLAAWFGLERWHDKNVWHAYKYAMSYDAIPLVADSVASIIKAILGKTKKCLVLDLDNTLWGGVIGDDGLEKIRIGKETPEAEAYSEFQQYLKGLKDRGVILAVCSKNDETTARAGFDHPDSVLSMEDFAVFRANWEPKHENIREIAKTLNIGMDALVFADDNPAEREIVRIHEPQVAVPELGSDVARYINIIDKAGYFETASLSEDDLRRNTFYAGNASRQQTQESFENYDDFLRSLDMTAEIAPFRSVYLDRITQLINKTNQFNLTTRRYTLPEIEQITDSSNHITLYGRLQDKFGDNGLVSAIIGTKKEDELHLDLWIMSCRVFKRGLESAMLDALVATARAAGIRTIVGYYRPTAKNGIVKNLFSDLGFSHRFTDENDGSCWGLNATGTYTERNSLIGVTT